MHGREKNIVGITESNLFLIVMGPTHTPNGILEPTVLL